MCSCRKYYRVGEEKDEPKVELKAVLPVCALSYLLLPHLLSCCCLLMPHCSKRAWRQHMRACIHLDYPHSRAVHWLWHHVRSACTRPCPDWQCPAGERARQRRRVRRNINKVEVDIAAHGWGGTVGPWCGVYNTRSSGRRIIPTRLGTAMMTSGRAAYKDAPTPH